MGGKLTLCEASEAGAVASTLTEGAAVVAVPLLTRLFKFIILHDSGYMRRNRNRKETGSEIEIKYKN